MINFIFNIHAQRCWGVSYGHLNRGLGLAKRLRERMKCKVLFIILSDKTAEKLILREKFIYHTVSSLDDTKYLIKLRSDNSKNIIIFDRPKIKIEPINIAQSLGYQTVMVGNAAMADLPVDLLIAGEFNENSNSKNIEETRLIGPEYMILEKIYTKPLVREISKKVNKVLVTFGGSDPSNLTEYITPWIKNSFPNYYFDIIIGPGYPKNNNLIKLIGDSKNIKLIYEPKTLYKLMLNSDFAISAAGISAYELAATGTPTIFIPSQQLENNLASEFQKRGFGINVGIKGVSTLTQLSNVFNDVSKNYDLRCKMSSKGRELINGQGLNLAVTAIQTLLNCETKNLSK